jgi:FAD/FMN-containing dehydrogenase
MTTSTITIAGPDGGRVGITPDQLADVGAQMAGPLLRAGDAGWDEAVRIWNALVASAPALVVQPTSARDVAAAVRFARAHGLLLSIKGGGHNIAGTAIAEGGLLLDMSRMRDIAVDPDARLAHVAPGCLLQEVDRATQAHGLATVLGFVSQTGVAGLTLGGGFGYLTRRFGWTVDNLAEVEIVTADGAIRTANRRENGELFWAIRGGGGNFGVATRFTFRLHRVGPTITGGLILWGAERADEVLAAYRDLTDSAPRELMATVVVLTAPPAPFVPAGWHGQPVIGMLLCHSGRNPEADLAAVRAVRDPIVDLVAARPYVAQQSILDESPSDATGLHQYWKAEYLPGLSRAYLEAFRAAALTRPRSPLSYAIMFHIGGALNEHPWDDGAVGNRDARFISGFAGVWRPGEGADEHVAWARDGWQRIRPFSTGGNYVNFQLAEDDPARTTAAYGNNYARLRRVKAEYDPGNLFRVNRNIPPAA